jgi:hypothetical protein
LVFLALAAGDLALRSRSALLEARRHELLRGDPAAKAAWALAKFPAQGADARTEALREAEKQFLLNESSAKMAYLWYKTAAEEFRLPFNPWADEARRRLPGALAAWQAELAAAGVKAEPWMLQ